MSEHSKAAPKWGEILHVNGDPVLVVRIKGGDWVEVADEFGVLEELITEDFDEYKPCTITINGIQVPEPVREGLRPYQQYWLADITAGIPRRASWKSTRLCREWLEDGLIHLIEQNAQIHIDAMRRANKGETE